jgi:hypothetical protein
MAYKVKKITYRNSHNPILTPINISSISYRKVYVLMKHTSYIRHIPVQNFSLAAKNKLSNGYPIYPTWQREFIYSIHYLQRVVQTSSHIESYVTGALQFFNLAMCLLLVRSVILGLFLLLLTLPSLT